MRRLSCLWPWAALALMAACVLTMNLFCIPAHDELSYAFAGQSTPFVGEVERVSSLWDIARQQYADYFKANGRVWVHGVVALFAGFRLYVLFDVFNTVMWFLLVWLVLREGKVPLRNAGTFCLGAAVVWWCLWYPETCSMNAAFAVNYLWTACATVCMMMLWRRLTHGWMVPIAFFFGWSQEVFALPTIAALAGGVLLRSLAERRLAVTVRQAVAWVLMVAGACFLCLGPAAMGRAGETLSNGVGALLLAALRGNFGLARLLWPMALLAVLLWIAWRRRKALWPMVMRAPEWWCFLVASYGLFCLISSNGLVRLSMPLLLAALVLALRERSALRIGAFPRRCLVVGTLAWMAVAAIWQIVLGSNDLRMLRRYKADPQGVTSFAAIPTGPLHLTVYRGSYNHWHRMLFRREVGHAKDPIFLTPWLHDTLYKAPERFFEEARELGEPGFFVAPRAPRAVVARGHMVPTPKQQAALEAYFASLDERPKGWARFLPGRLRAMFPVEDFYLAAPSEVTHFTAADGKPYTLVLSSLQVRR